MKNPLRSHETCERLLETAAEVFSRNGYRNTTFREICLGAQANSAAVNYHFRDKEHFYSAVVERVIEQEQDSIRDLQSRLDSPAPPEERLRIFVHWALDSLLGAGRANRLAKLMAHEMMEPTPALDMVIERVIKPMDRNVREIVGAILGERADPQVVADCATSIKAQCFLYHHARAIHARMGLISLHDQATIDRLAEHITRFTLGALRAERSALENKEKDHENR